MKIIFLTVLSVFALFALSTANNLPQGEMKTKADRADMPLPVGDGLTSGMSPKLAELTVKFILFNLKMRPRFEDGTIDHPKYKKKVQGFARRAQRISLGDIKESDEGNLAPRKVSTRSISAKNLESDSWKLPTMSRNACNNCNAGCAGAAVACRRGCLFTGPEGVVECEIAWAVVAAGCFGTCAVRFC